MTIATKSLGPFLGLNNRRADFALRLKKTSSDTAERGGLSGDFLRVANNVDIDNAGRIRSRRGTERVQAMSDAHSLIVTSTTGGFLVRDSVLYAITLPTYAETLLKILTSNARMSYVKIGTDWYYSNGTDSGRVTAGVSYPMSMATPVEPALTVIGGSLLTGWYQVGVAYVNATTGEEGGISPYAQHELTSTGGLRVTLPGTVLGASHINIYLSSSNGAVPKLHSSVTVGTATTDLTMLATGRPSTGRFEAPLPPGTLFEHNGRLCSFIGATVYIGEPYRPGYYLPIGGYIPFAADVTIAVTNQGGTYIVADKTYWVPGDLGDVKDTIKTILPHGAVPGTAFTVPNSATVGWFGDKGFVTGDAAGRVDTSMAANIDPTLPATGVSSVCECDGYWRVASCGYSMNLENSAVTTYSNWAFTSLSECYGTQADGIYRTDTDGPVDALVGFGKLDFDSDYFKSIPMVTFGVDALTAMTVRIQTPAAQDYTYTAKSSSSDLKIQRAVPGRGLRATWHEIEVSNTAGSAFSLASIKFDLIISSRRV